MTQGLLLSDTHFGFSDNTTKIWGKYWDDVIAKAPEFERLEVLILAGDVMSHETRQLKGAFRFFRERMGNKPILWVRGNHDFWDSRIKNLRYLIEKTDKWAEEYKIQGLHEGGLEITGALDTSPTLFLGYDCWYCQHPGGYTQCLSRMPGRHSGGWETHNLLSKRALSGFNHVIERCYEFRSRMRDSGEAGKIVIVTHMPGGYTLRHIGQPESWWNEAIVQADVLCYGHTHRRDERKVQDEHHVCQIYNAGSDYNRPNHLFFET